MNQSDRRGTFQDLVGAPSPSGDDLSVIVEMMGERTGLWQVSERRVGIIQSYAKDLSPRSQAAAKEMLEVAKRGDLFWTTKVEFYTVLSEIRMKSTSASKADVVAAIDGIIKGAKSDGMAHREWVKRALDVLVKISKE